MVPGVRTPGDVPLLEFGPRAAELSYPVEQRTPALESALGLSPEKSWQLPWGMLRCRGVKQLQLVGLFHRNDPWNVYTSVHITGEGGEASGCRAAGSPAICHLQAGGPGSWRCSKAHVQRPTSQRARGVSPGLRTRSPWCPQVGGDGRPCSIGHGICPSVFTCSRALRGLGGASPCC